MQTIRRALLALVTLSTYVAAQNITVNVLQPSLPAGVSVIVPPLQPAVALGDASCGGLLLLMQRGLSSSFIFTGVGASVTLLQVIGGGGALVELDGTVIQSVQTVSSTDNATQCDGITVYTGAVQYGQHNLSVVSNFATGTGTTLYVNSFQYDPGAPSTNSASSTQTSGGGASTTSASAQLTKSSSKGPIIGGVVAALVVVIAAAISGFLFWRRRERQNGEATGRQTGPGLLDSPDSDRNAPGGSAANVGMAGQLEMAEPYPATLMPTANPYYPSASSEAPTQTSEKRSLVTSPSPYPSQPDISHTNRVSYASDWPGMRSSVAPDDSVSVVASGSGSGRPFSEIEVIQGLMARNLPTPALAAAIELMAGNRGASVATPMPTHQEEDHGPAPPSYQPQ